nr:MAG TPA: hypothetical protein [Caudoviricetes sp.]
MNKYILIRITVIMSSYKIRNDTGIFKIAPNPVTTRLPAYPDARGILWY